MTLSAAQKKVSKQLSAMLKQNSKKESMNMSTKKVVAKKSAVKKVAKKLAAKKHAGLLKGLKSEKLAVDPKGIIRPRIKKGMKNKEFLPYKKNSAIRALFEKLEPGKLVTIKTLFNVPKKEYAKSALNRLARHGILNRKWNIRVVGSGSDAKVQMLRKIGFKKSA